MAFRVPDAYLGAPDYLNAMKTAAAMSQAQRSRRGGAGARMTMGEDASPRGDFGGGGTGGSGGMPAQGNMMGMYDEQIKEEQVRQAQQKTQDMADANMREQVEGRLKEEAAPGERRKTDLGNQMKEQEIKNLEREETSTIMKNAAKFVPQLTKDTYGDWVDWVGETKKFPTTFFKPWSDVMNMTDMEWKVYQSNLEKMGDPDSASVTKAISLQKKEAAAYAKAKKAAKKEFISVQGKIDSAKNSGGVSNEMFATLPPKVKAMLAGADRSEYIGMLEQYAQELANEYDFSYEPKPSVVNPAENGGLSDDMINRYMTMYPGRTRDQIIAAYNAQVGR